MGQLFREDSQNLELLGGWKESEHAAISRSRRSDVFWMVGGSARKIISRLLGLLGISTGATSGTLCPRCATAYTLVPHILSRKEIMVSALSGRPPRQAPRYLTVLLAALEDLIKDPEARLHWKVLAWWSLVQAWGTRAFFRRTWSQTTVECMPSSLGQKSQDTTKSSYSGLSSSMRERLFSTEIVSHWLEGPLRGCAI